MTEYLPPPELQSLTACKQPAKQATWLKDKAIPHRVDGKRIIVSREHVRAWLEGKSVATGGLNMGAIA